MAVDGPPACSLVVMGVAGSGKTTVGRALATDLCSRFLDGDDLHPAANREKMRAGIPLTDADRAPWLAALSAELHAAPTGQAGGGLVVACSALRAAYRAVLRAGPARVRFVYLAVPRDELARRLAGRTGHFFNLQLLDSQLATLEEPAATEGALRLDAMLPVCDLVAAVRQWMAGGGT
jgi:gluconokinase